MPDGSHPALISDMSGHPHRMQPVGLRRKLVAGLLLAVGLIFCGLIALLSIAVALIATVLNGLRALKLRRGPKGEKSPTVPARISEI
jgi:hypothetical protein